MRKLIIITLLLITVSALNAQTTKIDSLENLLQKHTNEDTVKVDLLNELALITISSNIEMALKYALEAEEIAVKTDYKKGKAESLFSIGRCYYKLSDFVQALKYLNHSMKLNIELNNRNMIPKCQIMIGNMHNMQGLHSVALDDCQKALVIFEELNNMKGISSCYNNLGNISLKLLDTTKALFYYNKALMIKENMGDSIGISAVLNNIGTVYENINDNDQAIAYLKKSLSISNSINYYVGMINNNRNIAVIYKDLDSLSLALTYCNKAFELAKKTNNKYEIQFTYRTLGSIYYKQGNYQKALNCYYNSLIIANELELLDAQKEIFKQFSEIYSATKRYKKAYENHILFKQLNDSIFSTKNIKKIASLEMQYEYEKEKQTEKLEQQKKDAIAAKEIKYHKTMRNIFVVGFFIAILVIILFIRIIRIKKRANILLYKKNQEISEQKKHIVEQKSEIQTQAEKLETSNEELKATNEDLFMKSEIIKVKNAELKTTLQHLKETQSQLLQADKMASIGVLTAGVAHEINNPLNYIMGGYVGLSDFFEETADKQEEHIPILLSSIKTGIDKVSNIVKGLNQFSRSNDAKNEDCDIHSIINNCLLILNSQLVDRIIVNKNISGESILMYGNVGKLHQVFINLLTNSIQSIDNSGTISISTQEIDENVVIEISDTGCGISKEFISKVTEPFFTTKDPGKGTGLGLSITYTIVKEHNGEIIFESEINEGTTVKIIFPLKKNKA